MLQTTNSRQFYNFFYEYFDNLISMHHQKKVSLRSQLKEREKVKGDIW